MSGLDLAGARVVITGAGAGIGAALAVALAGRGARLVLNDLDGAAAAAVAADLGDAVVEVVGGDMSVAADVNLVVDTANDVLGGVDLFCANAGIALPGSWEPAVFERNWQVNVLSHVHAARALLPGWLAAGRGRFLATVSAAGLLTMPGNAAYSVAKHAALGFAEWLRITYAHRGITVQALCPQGVLTAILERADPRSAAVLVPDAITAEEVADCVLTALAGDEFLILPHPEVAGRAARRGTDRDGWLAAMNRSQQRLEQAFPDPVADSFPEASLDPATGAEAIR